MMPYYHLYLIHMVRLHPHPGLRHLPNSDSGHKLPSSFDASRSKRALLLTIFEFQPTLSPTFLTLSPISLLFSHYLLVVLSLSSLPHLPFLPLPQPFATQIAAPPVLLVLDLMDPPPTGLLAGSTAPPPRQAVFNPYRLPVSPPPGNVRPQPHRQPELLWLHWMVCLAAWTTEALCAHPMMSQEVPPDEHFETISARNIYIQLCRAVHEFNVQQRRIARGVSLL